MSTGAGIAIAVAVVAAVGGTVVFIVTRDKPRDVSEGQRGTVTRNNANGGTSPQDAMDSNIRTIANIASVGLGIIGQLFPGKSGAPSTSPNGTLPPTSGGGAPSSFGQWGSPSWVM